MSETVDFPVYAVELRFQGAAAKMAFDHLTAAVDRRRELGEKLRAIRKAGGPVPLEAEQNDYRAMAMEMLNLVPRILEAVQSFLVAAGVISMLLWPDPRPRGNVSAEVLVLRERRGEYFRKRLNVGDDSALRKLRVKRTDARGGLVHYDEMLEEFSGLTSSDDLVTFEVGSLARLPGAWAPAATVRWLDDETLTLNVNGRETQLRPLLDEIGRVVGQIQVSGKEGLVAGTSPTDLTSLAVGIGVERK